MGFGKGLSIESQGLIEFTPGIPADFRLGRKIARYYWTPSVGQTYLLLRGELVDFPSIDSVMRPRSWRISN